MLERQRKHLEDIRLTKGEKLEGIIVQTLYIIFFILYNAFECYLIYLIGKYNGRVIEVLFITLAFFANKAMFGKPLHFSNNFICLGSSGIAFYIATRITWSLGISIVMCVLTGVAVGAITSYIATYALKEKQKRNLVEEIAELKLNTEQILEVCKRNGLDEEIGYIVDFRLTHNEDLTCYEFSIDRSTLNRKLNKFLFRARN